MNENDKTELDKELAVIPDTEEKEIKDIRNKNYEYDIIAREYVNNGFNIKRALLSVRNYLTEHSAEVLGSLLLRNLEFQKALNNIIPTDVDDYEIIQAAYKAKRKTGISYAELHKFLETNLKLKGKLSTDNKPNVNIGLFIQNKDT